MKSKLKIYHYAFCILLFCIGCKKDWLEVKPDKSLSVPQTLQDFQSILDDENVLNRQYSILANAGTDNVFIADQDAGNLFESDVDQYIWNEKINWLNESAIEWNHPFTVINSANIVLDGLEKFPIDDPTVAFLKGQALFYRAYAYYSLAQVFCKPYQASNATNELGLPIRLHSDVNQTSQRSSLQEVYDQIVIDLKTAATLLPETVTYLTRTNSIAAKALLARVFLNMNDYNNAKQYCDLVLLKKGTLLDYNNTQIIKPSSTYRFPAKGIGNNEIIFYAFSSGGYYRQSGKGSVVQASNQLYNLYENNDLRKELIYTASGNKLNFVGCYTGSNAIFFGIATNEIYLIRAECNARSGRIVEAQNDLNYLLRNRYKTGTAPIISESDPKQLIHIVIDQRRKELPRYGNSRWEDLRRFNMEPEFSITQSCIFNGQVYTLPPNSPRYVLNIPNKEIRLSGIKQNQR